MVLLKNVGRLLPLDKYNLSSIALIGRDAADPTVGGGGSGGSFPYYKSTPLAAIRQRFAGITPPPPPPSTCPGKLLQHTDLANGKKTVRVAHFLYKNDHFTKTGSGQTWGKHSDRDAFSYR